MMKIRYVKPIVRWVLDTFFPNADIVSCLAFLDKVDLWFRTRGPEWTINRLKDLRLILWHQVAGTTYHVSYLAMYKDLPLVFKPWFTLVHNRDPETLRLLNTLLNVSKIIRWWKPIDYSTMTDPLKADPIAVMAIGSELKRLALRLRLPKIETDCLAYHFSGHQGPSGPALLSSLLEVTVLPEDLINNIRILGGTWILEQLLECRRITTPIIGEICSLFGIKGKPKIRRIAHRLAFEGKRRPIGIFDYWSQCSLKALHEGLFRILRTLPSDMTFDQGRFARGRIPSGPYFSFDLHAATDRFPLSLQIEVLSTVIGAEKAKAWGEIMSKYEFHTPEGHLVKYNVGQPLGGYSSWASFALCHHLLVKLAAERSGKNPRTFQAYWLLGDDLVIRDASVAKHYLVLLSQIGVEVSLDKSLVSQNTFEFAKRLIVDQREVTGLSLNAITEATGWLDLWAYMMTVGERGFVLPEARYSCFKKLLVLMGNSRSYATRAAFKMRSLGLIQMVIKEHPIDGGLTRQWLNEFGFHLGPSKDHFGLEFTLECIAALKVQEIQNSLITVTKEVNVFIQQFATLAAGQVSLTSETVRALPPVGAFLEKGTCLQREGMTVESLARSQDWIGLLRSGIELVPDPRRTITRTVTADRVKESSSLINKLILLIKEEISRRMESGYPLA